MRRRQSVILRRFAAAVPRHIGLRQTLTASGQSVNSRLAPQSSLEPTTRCSPDTRLPNCPGAEVTLLLRSVDVAQADLVLNVGRVEHGHSVTVGDADNAAGQDVRGAAWRRQDDQKARDGGDAGDVVRMARLWSELPGAEQHDSGLRHGLVIRRARFDRARRLHEKRHADASLEGLALRSAQGRVAGA